MLFSYKEDEPINEININNIEISRVFSIKFLEVHIDHELSWKIHIANTCKKVSKCIGILNKAMYVLSTRILNTLYNVLIVPHLIFYVEVWGNTYILYIKYIIYKTIFYIYIYIYFIYLYI